MATSNGKLFLNTLFWGIALWLFGYVLGIIFFSFVPQDMIGWYIMPFGIIATLWVLFTRIKRDSFVCYVGIGSIWILIAIILDYLLLVQMFQVTNYYRLDVYIYYVLTFALPVIVGFIKKDSLTPNN